MACFSDKEHAGGVVPGECPPVEDVIDGSLDDLRVFDASAVAAGDGGTGLGSVGRQVGAHGVGKEALLDDAGHGASIAGVFRVAERLPVSSRAAAVLGDVHEMPRWDLDPRCSQSSVVHVRDHDGVVGTASRKVRCAVDRVDDPTTRA